MLPLLLIPLGALIVWSLAKKHAEREMHQRHAVTGEIEGLIEHKLHQAFLDEQAGQCGYCLSGVIVSAAALLERIPHPTRADITAALEPHLCRCGTHTRILRAVERAAS